MGWRQWSEGSGNGIAAEHVIVVPKTHRFAVNNQVMLHLSGLGAQPIIRRDTAIQYQRRLSISPLVLAQGREAGLNGLT